MTISRPDRSETETYYFRYIDQVGDGDIRDILERQAGEFGALLAGISEAQSTFRYEPGKWSLREMLGHVNDTERVFAFRAMWFARGFDSALPGFDQDVAVATAGGDARPWASHVAEFAAVRAATIALFRSLPDDAWTRQGTASGFPFTVRALAYIAVGHVSHHAAIVADRYLRQR